MQSQKITIQILASSQKLKKNFPIDPKSDIEIIFKKKKFKLQKAHLKLQSTYFRNTLNSERSILEIKQNFNEQFFTNVLWCFYGEVLLVERKYILQYYPIVHYLQIQALIKILRKDIIENINKYNFFKLFNLAYRYSDQKIFEKCLNKLQCSNYSLLQKQKQQFLNINLQLFKFVIKSHNKLDKNKKIYNIYQIHHLLKQYCKIHQFSQEFNSQLKFQLIDKNKLTAQEYQLIFINDNKYQNPAIKKEGAKLSDENKFPKNKLQKSFQLQMQINFLKKIQQQLIQKKNNYCNQIDKLNSVNQNQVQKNNSLINQFNLIKQKINQHQSEQNDISEQIENIDINFELIQKKFDDQSQKIQKLINNTQQILKKYQTSKQASKQKNNSFNANSFQNLFTKKKQKFQPPILSSQKSIKSTKSLSQSNASTNKNQTQYISLTQIEIQSPISMSKHDMYLSQDRIQFLAKSHLIKNCSQLKALAEIISQKNYVMQLKLIFRASKDNSKFVKGNQQTADGIRKKSKNKDKLLFLCRTQADKLIGGYTSIPLNLYTEGNYKDENAYIFSVTSNKKFKVKLQQVQEAIIIHKGYIICFGNDLMISQKLFQMENYCGWPNTYQNFQSLHQRASDWFAGNSQFSIKQIQCYRLDYHEGENIN